MRTVRALWGSSHPGPTLVVTALALALGVATGLETWRLALLTTSVFAGQLSVGISNDALDAERDRAVGRIDKPIARGDVSARVAWGAALGLLATALLLSAPLGWRMLAAHALALGSAWAYNAGLKSTPWSIVPFLVSFGIFPSLATLSAPDPSFAAGWAWIAGAALGAAVHLTNVLPDLDDDARTGVRGLPHRLGPRVAAIVAALAVVGGAVAVLLGAAGGDLGAISPVSWIFFAAVVAVAAVTAWRAISRPPTRALFRLVMLAALLLAAQLVASGSAFVA
ncbi:4-hydroxybenzoate polyprenyltransferase [Microbacterium trichothecenolyticum]|uniref:UbiA family prenyltransferase n=1 Tax=Microbacterium trichothecenolyticum TaxID=69370 RepID=UPI002864385A|nr:UbiA family prenyltransferase [Microbacterium trichothecenolyticum]MDR7110311.1 4-hydroxybenzoate polyprenyltransferase [Microbacterium trichothecenolyticum]